ncbi:hypothetical protein ACWF95_40930 [Streptomyces vinaceus]
MPTIDPAVSLRIGGPGARRLIRLLAEIAYLLEGPDPLRFTDEQAAILGKDTGRAELTVWAREIAAELRFQL